MKKGNETELAIQKAFLTEDRFSSCRFRLFNMFVFGWESDVLILTKNGYWYEYEVKVSLQDFRNDFRHKTDKHGVLRGEKDGLRPNYFSYVVPDTLVDRAKELLPEGYGLCSVTDGKLFSVVIQPRPLHSTKMTPEELNLMEKLYYNYLSWWKKGMSVREREAELKAEIQFIKAEYKAAVGYELEDML